MSLLSSQGRAMCQVQGTPHQHMASLRRSPWMHALSWRFKCRVAKLSLSLLTSPSSPPRNVAALTPRFPPPTHTHRKKKATLDIPPSLFLPQLPPPPPLPPLPL
eukprot:Sspe_Gene.72725::Locus_43524_Transcript_1_1_Confidence_1.000_Length_476::g.72725::m.72725